MSKGISDGGIYHSSQPAAQNQFRSNTNGHDKMAGVHYATFMCKACKQPKRAEGSKWIDPRHTKLGRLCADCAPAPVAAPPVAPKRPAKATPQPKPEKPPKVQKMTDEQVLECRAAFEFEGASRRSLELKYDVSTTYMSQLLDYVVRSKLIPRRHLSPGK